MNDGGRWVRVGESAASSGSGRYKLLSIEGSNGGARLF